MDFRIKVTTPSEHLSELILELEEWKYMMFYKYRDSLDPDDLRVLEQQIIVELRLVHDRLIEIEEIEDGRGSAK